MCTVGDDIAKCKQCADTSKFLFKISGQIYGSCVPPQSCSVNPY